MTQKEYLTREERAKNLLENPNTHILRINDNHYQMKSLATNRIYDIYSTESGGISKEDLGEKTGFTINGGTFNTYLSELRRNDLIEINDSMINPSKEFFQ